VKALSSSLSTAKKKKKERMNGHVGVPDTQI
jgi:hypothetical protein